MEGLSLSRIQLAAQNARQQAAAEKLQQLGTQAGSGQEMAGLKEAARQFEGVFLNNMMKAMRRTVPQNELFNSGGPTKFYQQMLDQEMAQTMATGSSRVGIADLIIRQFQASVTGQSEIQPQSAPPAPAPLAMDRYRSMGEITGTVAERARLRREATEAGPAVADTLQRFESEIHRSSANHDLDPALVLAVVMQESAGDPRSRSPKGAIGLMQLMPGTARELGVTDATSPAQNLAGGTRYLANMLQRYEGDLDLALAAYNAGPGNVDKAGRAVPNFPETQNYVAKVRALYEKLGGTNLASENSEQKQTVPSGEGK